MKTPDDPLYPDDPVATPQQRGRGALSNDSSRFDRERRLRTDDGWGAAAPLDADDELPPLRTTLTRDATRTIIARNSTPDIGFDRSINPYRGCEHGCIYCFARPTHAYLGLSPGLDFETRLLYKPEAAALLARELAAPKYRCDVIALGTNTDPYQPVERELKVTRQILRTLESFNHPLGIVTKNHMVTRDIDILAPMAKRNLAEVMISITTLDRALARDMEPRASAPHRRLDAIKQLADAGIPVGVLTSPMIPGLNDHEMEAILDAAAAAGATRASYIVLRLPLEIKELFEEWLRAHRPDRAERVLGLVREMRGGALYQAEFGRRMKGEGAYAELLRQRFAAAARRLDLNRARYRLDTTQFRVPDEARVDRRADPRQARLL